MICQRNYQEHYQGKHKGFTLIELISVIVVLSIIGAFSATFIVRLTQQFVVINDKATLLTDSRLATEYMVRKLRLALPYSLRVSNSDRCLQYLPIVASGKYLNELPSVANGAPPTRKIPAITVVPSRVSTDGVSNNAEFLAVGAAANSEVYGINPASLSSVQSMTSASITLKNNKQWLRNSINQRFYLTAKPSAFCLMDNEIRFYRSLSLTDDDVDLTSAYDLLAQSVIPLNDLYRISESVENQSSFVTLSFRFIRGDTQFDMVRQVVIRHVQ